MVRNLHMHINYQILDKLGYTVHISHPVQKQRGHKENLVCWCPRDAATSVYYSSCWSAQLWPSPKAMEVGRFEQFNQKPWQTSALLVAARLASYTEHLQGPVSSAWNRDVCGTTVNPSSFVSQKLGWIQFEKVYLKKKSKSSRIISN